MFTERASDGIRRFLVRGYNNRLSPVYGAVEFIVCELQPVFTCRNHLFDDRGFVPDALEVYVVHVYDK